MKYNRDVYEYNLLRVREVCKRISPGLSVVAGNEIFYNDDTVSALESGECKCIGHSRYVLTEFSPRQDFTIIRNGLNRLLASGFRPILAHIERYECIHGRVDLVDTLIDMGVYIQVNADSIVSSGLRGGKWARKIIRGRRVHFVATDAHNTDSRAPRLLKCAKYLSRFGDSYAKALLFENQMRVLNNEQIL